MPGDQKHLMETKQEFVRDLAAGHDIKQETDEALHKSAARLKQLGHATDDRGEGSAHKQGQNAFE